MIDGPMRGTEEIKSPAAARDVLGTLENCHGQLMGFPVIFRH